MPIDGLAYWTDALGQPAPPDVQMPSEDIKPPANAAPGPSLASQGNRQPLSTHSEAGSNGSSSADRNGLDSCSTHNEGLRWMVEVTPATDPQGWQYSSQFSELDQCRAGGRATRRGTGVPLIDTISEMLSCRYVPTRLWGA
jgi:hypothetical protein